MFDVKTTSLMVGYPPYYRNRNIVVRLEGKKINCNKHRVSLYLHVHMFMRHRRYCQFTLVNSGGAAKSRMVRAHRVSCVSVAVRRTSAMTFIFVTTNEPRFLYETISDVHRRDLLCCSFHCKSFGQMVR